MQRISIQAEHSTQRFRIEESEEAVSNALYKLYEIKCVERNMKFEGGNLTKNYCLRVARWLCNPDKKIGLLLRGGVGNGKTTMLKAVCHLINFILSDEFPTAKYREIYSISAGELPDIYFTAPEYFSKLKTMQMLAIDEIGCENLKQKEFGVNLMIDILQYRYDKQLFTIATSNLSDEDFKERYCDRVDDRMREMFDMLLFENQSFRK